MKYDTSLRLEGVSKVYPGTVALEGVNVEMRHGEVHGVVGKNGAGKSTLVGIISGLIRPSNGLIRLKGAVYPYLTPALASKAGVAIVPQEPEVVGELTVAENLFFPHYATRGRGFLMDWRRLFSEAQRVLERGGVDFDPRYKVKDLTIGQQQLLLILKAFYVLSADIVILDEASSSLPERDKRLLFDIVRSKRAEGGTIVYISHSLDELLEICDRMTVLRDGLSIATVHAAHVEKPRLASLIVGQPARGDDGYTPASYGDRRLSTNGSATGQGASTATGHSTAAAAGRHLAGAMQELGRDSSVPPPPVPPPPVPPPPVPHPPVPHPSASRSPSPPLLAVDGLRRAGRLDGVSFRVHRGEIVGLAGLLGSGRTEILKAIAGIDPPDDGAVFVEGQEVTPPRPSAAMDHGIVYLPEDRDEEGLVHMLAVRKNVSLSWVTRLTRRMFVRRKEEDELAVQMVHRLDIRLASHEQEVRQLSGGNRQKVVFGKIAATSPKIYLLDEPTKGIDIAARESLLKLIRHELSTDAAVVMSAPGLEDLLAICDRILVVRKGRIIDEFERTDFDEEVLYHAIQGASGRKGDMAQ